LRLFLDFLKHFQKIIGKDFLERRDVKIKSIISRRARGVSRETMSENLPEAMTETVSVIAEIHENINIYT